MTSESLSSWPLSSLTGLHKTNPAAVSIRLSAHREHSQSNSLWSLLPALTDTVQRSKKIPAHLFGGVLLLSGVSASQLVLYAVSVLQLFDLINPDQPVLWSEGFLQVPQLYVLVSDLSIACSVEAWWRPEVQLNRDEDRWSCLCLNPICPLETILSSSL